MKRALLVVAPFLPWPADFGGAARIYHLIRELAPSHEIILAAPARPDESDGIRALGEMCDVTAVPARWTPRQPADRRKRLLQLRSLAGRASYHALSARNLQLQAVIDRLFLTRRIDVTQFEMPQTAAYRLPRPCPTVLNTQNIEHELLHRVAAESRSLSQRVFNLAEAQKVRAFERYAWRRVDVCVATSQRDADALARATGRPAVVVPNGVDFAWFGELPRDVAAQPLVVFTGAMRHAPNAEGARWFAESVLPSLRRAVPNARFAIVGADPPPSVAALASDAVLVTGRVDDVRPWLSHAAVAVVPLRSGGGTRLKILEAFAAGAPVVSTTLGAEGLEIVNGKHLLVADSPDAFAAAVARALRDPALAARLTAAGKALAREHYDWSRIAPRLIAAHDLAIERFGGGACASRNPR